MVLVRKHLSFAPDFIAAFHTHSHKKHELCWEFYGLVNNEVMSSRSVNSGTVPGQASKWLTST